MNDIPNSLISFAEFELDTVQRKLRRNGEVVEIHSKAFDLLAFLAQNNGRIVSKEEILDTIWEGQFVEESNLTVQISNLRKALGETKNSSRLLVTIPGKGYKFIAEIDETDLVIETHSFSQITIEKEEDIINVKPILPEKSGFNFSWSGIIFVAILVFSSVGAIGGYWFFNQTKNSGANLPVVSAEKKSNIKRLTSKGNVTWGVLSPDGRFFAYSFREMGNLQTDLRIGQVSSNSDLQLLPIADFVYYPRSFSADGNWLYYTASKPREFDNGTLYKISVLGGIPQKLVDGISISSIISPDEKQIAFMRVSGENKPSTLVTANLNGSDEREIAVRPAGQSFLRRSLSWSADGSRLAFGARSGKGESLEVFSANVADGSVKQITSSDWLVLEDTAWLRDGKGLIIIARKKDSFAANQIWQVDYESGIAQRISNDIQDYGFSLNLSADSNALLAKLATVESSIWIAPAENPAGARQITFSSVGHEGWYGIDWTSDGKIIYTKRVDQSLTIWSMDTLGANAVQLTSAGFLDERPSATADGKYIVFQSNRSGETEIWRMNANGTDLRQITFDGKNTVPHCTPDSKTIVYMHNAEGKNFAYRISIEGGEAEKITDAEIFNPRVSPDGKFIVGGVNSEGKTKLAVFSIADGAAVKSFDVPPSYNFTGSIRWSRDGKSIIYRDWADGIWSQSIEGGTPARLKGLPKEKLLQFDWSPDSKQIAFVRERIQSDLVLMTDFR
jgi:Tol biopolymer transport system component/DNA-binding winged helix-turn-helix (wHTH) protein